MKKALAGLFILVVCIPMFFSFLLISDLLGKRMEAVIKRRVTSQLQIAGNLLKRNLEELTLKARFISQQKDIQQAFLDKDPIELIDRLNRVRKDLRLDLYEGGIEIYSKDGSLFVSEPVNPFKVSNETAVKNALAGNFSEIRITNKGRLLFCSTVPVYSPSESQPVGAVAIGFVLDDAYADELRRVATTEIVLLALSEKNCSVLASTVMEKGKRFFPVLPGLNEDFREVGVASRRFIVKAKIFEASSGSFALAVAFEKTELSSVIVSIRRMLLFTALGAILFALGLAVLFSKCLTSPIESLVVAAQELGRGNLDVRINLETATEEFSILGKTFDDMRCQIKTKLHELEMTNDELDHKVFDLSVRNLINQAIITKNEDSVLRELLQIIVDTMGASRSSMLLVDPQTDRLALKVVVFRNKPDEAFVSGANDNNGISFELGEGIAGYVAKTGKPVFSNNPAEDMRFKPGAKGSENRLENLITVPLRGEKEILGVVNLSDREEDFTEEDQNLLQGIADQIAIALQKARLYELAITDGMTGLYIHRYFQMRLEAEVARSRRSEEPLSLLMFDIDHFKKFNDTWGHQLGDKVIKLVADTIRQNVREGIDIPARYGGEEFAVIMPDTSLDGAAIFAERLRKVIESASIMHEKNELKVTISLGCAAFPANALERETLIKAADAALYVSKEKGRNCVSRAENIES
jgi:diguanylate cyclase (GGDEF)-like protein